MKRRTFVATTGAVVGSALLPGALHSGAPSDGPVVLFQGDSITDCGRDRKNPHPNAADALGNGYPLLIASTLLAAQPGRGFRFYNRGVSGNTVPDLDARWQADTLDLAPDVLSILIGVNDYWHVLMGTYHGTVDDYAHELESLLTRTRQSRPGIRLVLLEPFTLRTGVVKDSWFPEFDQRRAVAGRVAERAGAALVPLQAMFDGLTRNSPPAYWSGDGVHPTAAGHGAIAKAWMDAVQL
ncbi:MAG TPA: SGNH/GDSL hydrolase family protein [Gemmatimonadales bacterium]